MNINKKIILILALVVFSVVVITSTCSHHKLSANTTSTTSITTTVPTSSQSNDRVSDIKSKVSKVMDKLDKRYTIKHDDIVTIVMTSEQRMFLVKNGEVFGVYSVSTSKYGSGNESGSNKTPLGTHSVKSKIGDGAAIGAIFKSRVNTGKIAEISQSKKDLTDNDYVTTRVLPLEGLEKGVNKGYKKKNGKKVLVDSAKRYIYIHGTPEEGLIGQEASHGCIRMINSEVIELFDILKVGSLVEIIE